MGHSNSLRAPENEDEAANPLPPALQAANRPMFVADHKMVLQERHKRAQEEADTRRIKADLAGKPANDNAVKIEDPNRAAKSRYRTEQLENKQPDLAHHMDELLANYSAKENADAQAAKALAFEATVDYCVEQGKLNGEAVMLRVMRALNKGLIRPNHIHLLCENHRGYAAPMVFLQTLDEKTIAKLTARFKGKGGEKKFVEFYWTTVMAHPSVRSAFKENGEFMTMGQEEDEAKKIEAIEDAYAGQLAYVRANKRKMRKDPRLLRQHLGWFLTAHGIGIAQRNPDNGKKDRRFIHLDTTAVPRVSKELLGKKQTIAEIDREIWETLIPVEQKLLTLIAQPDLKFSELQHHLREAYKIDVESLEDFYNRLDYILKEIFPDKEPRRGLWSRISPFR